MSAPKVPIERRLWPRCRSVGDCLVWTGHVTNGYGSICRDGRQERVHRVAYELVKGPIAEGLTIDHLCRNQLCVNPDHLEAVSMKENILRGTSPSARNAIKMHCKNGHPFDDENTATQTGGRKCRECSRASVRKYRSKIRGAKYDRA